MNRTTVTLITGANGEIGHGLIRAITERSPETNILALDLKDLDPEIESLCYRTVLQDITDSEGVMRLGSEYHIDAVFHLAALLSTKAEAKPNAAHRVNVGGTLNLLNLALSQFDPKRGPTRFLFPSSIAVYGTPDGVDRGAVDPINEQQWLEPKTMYGCNKLYCEHLGRYFARHYQQRGHEPDQPSVDFRCIRYPGLISAFTVPSGGTSDYGPQMIHSAAKGEAYACFVDEDTRLPFMAMPDAIQGTIDLMEAPKGDLTTTTYNINAFAPSADEFAELTRKAFPDSVIRFVVNENRQRIVHGWPARVDDARARADWGFAPAFDFGQTFEAYLLPEIRRRYP